MSKATVLFIKASIIYFLVAAILGVIMGIWHWNGLVIDALLLAHVHFGLLGWMSMMIYGVGYHILPRFNGTTLYSPKMADVQFWLANIGLIGMGVLWALSKIVKNDFFQLLLIISYIIEGISVLLFVYNMLRTMNQKVESPK
ncbi:MAG: cbb3-type cytochrome c oxidase subunit I [Candidatus Firestonebacteria bacterium]